MLATGYIVYAQKRTEFDLRFISQNPQRDDGSAWLAHSVINANQSESANFRQEPRANEPGMDAPKPTPIRVRPQFLLPHSTLARSHRHDLT